MYPLILIDDTVGSVSHFCVVSPSAGFTPKTDVAVRGDGGRTYDAVNLLVLDDESAPSAVMPVRITATAAVSAAALVTPGTLTVTFPNDADLDPASFDVVFVTDGLDGNECDGPRPPAATAAGVAGGDGT